MVTNNTILDSSCNLMSFGISSSQPPKTNSRSSPQAVVTSYVKINSSEPSLLIQPTIQSRPNLPATNSTDLSVMTPSSILADTSSALMDLSKTLPRKFPINPISSHRLLSTFPDGNKVLASTCSASVVVPSNILYQTPGTLISDSFPNFNRVGATTSLVKISNHKDASLMNSIPESSIYTPVLNAKTLTTDLSNGLIGNNRQTAVFHVRTSQISATVSPTSGNSTEQWKTVPATRPTILRKRGAEINSSRSCRDSCDSNHNHQKRPRKQLLETSRPESTVVPPVSTVVMSTCSPTHSIVAQEEQVGSESPLLLDIPEINEFSEDNIVHCVVQNSSCEINGHNVSPGEQEYSFHGHIRPQLPYTFSWRSRLNHFDRPSDVLAKKCPPSSLSSLVDNRVALSGWRLIHLIGGVTDLLRLEKSTQTRFEHSVLSLKHSQPLELIQDNIHRSQRLQDILCNIMSTLSDLRSNHGEELRSLSGCFMRLTSLNRQKKRSRINTEPLDAPILEHPLCSDKA